MTGNNVLGITMAVMKKSWTGKKSPTNPIKKEKHDCRKYKTVYLDDIRKKEQQQELKDLFYDTSK